MELLGIFYSVIGFLIVIVVGLLFFVKNEKSNSIILRVVTIFAILTALLSISSMPSNDMLGKIVAGVIGMVALVGYAMRFKYKNDTCVPKILMTISLVATFIFMLL